MRLIWPKGGVPLGAWCLLPLMAPGSLSHAKPAEALTRIEIRARTSASVSSSPTCAGAQVRAPRKNLRSLLALG